MVIRGCGHILRLKVSCGESILNGGSVRGDLAFNVCKSLHLELVWLVHQRRGVSLLGKLRCKEGCSRRLGSSNTPRHAFGISYSSMLCFVEFLSFLAVTVHHDSADRGLGSVGLAEVEI